MTPSSETRLRETLLTLDGPTAPVAASLMVAGAEATDATLAASITAAGDLLRLSVAAVCVFSSGAVGLHEMFHLPKPLALALGAINAWLLLGAFIRQRWQASRLWRKTMWARRKG